LIRCLNASFSATIALTAKTAQHKAPMTSLGFTPP
jgi:hypothetical protein